MITFIKVLHNILFAAGDLAIAVLASVVSYYGKPELGLGIILTATAMLATLLVASAVVNRRHKLAVRSAQNAEAATASAPTKTYSAHASEAYDHDAHTVWSLIRPAESAVLLSDAQRAFTVPGRRLALGSSNASSAETARYPSSKSSERKAHGGQLRDP